MKRFSLTPLIAIAFALLTSVAMGLLAACGGFDDALSAPGSSGSSGSTTDASSFADGGVTAPPVVGVVSGIVIVHAAAYPSFRLCFEKYPDIAPQPDNTVMPEANIVGVEVGSAVRIGPLAEAPGKVYIIDRRTLRGDGTPKPCKKVIAESRENLEYHVAGPIDQPLGVGRVDVLAVTGCADESRLIEFGIPGSECGANWTPVKGSMDVRSLSVFPSFAATPTMLPVQLVHMSSTLEAQRAGNVIDVTFGEVDGGSAALQHTVAVRPELFDASAPSTLKVNQDSDDAIYGTQGFRIALRPSSPDGGSGSGPPSFTVDQSLAEVQDLSSPTTVPTTYYLAASNYVLLLLGDPRIQRKYPDGGTNLAFDPRRAVHLLAVPVKDPATEDAGAPEPVDAGPPTNDQ